MKRLILDHPGVIEIAAGVLLLCAADAYGHAMHWTRHLETLKADAAKVASEALGG